MKQKRSKRRRKYKERSQSYLLQISSNGQRSRTSYRLMGLALKFLLYFHFLKPTMDPASLIP